MSAEQRILDAAKRLTSEGDFTYERPRGDDTPIPTCVGCNMSAWNPDRIKHASGCAVEDLIAAVRALGKGAK